jgi:glycerol-3-phosphate acyltransferase PlsY
MEDHWLYLITAAAAYLIGSLNGSLLASRLLLRDDIRKHGSGNAGATNVLRTYGTKWTLAVLLWDVGRGVLAMWLGRLLLPETGYGMLLAGFFVIIGHVFPLYFGFRGGKGVITACAVMFALDWQVASVALGLFVLIVILTRYVSLGSICAVTTLPVLGLLFDGRDWSAVGTYAAVAALVIFLHKDNIKRLLTGTENKFSVRKNSS